MFVPHLSLSLSLRLCHLLLLSPSVPLNFSVPSSLCFLLTFFHLSRAPRSLLPSTWFRASTTIPPLSSPRCIHLRSFTAPCSFLPQILNAEQHSEWRDAPVMATDCLALPPGHRVAHLLVPDSLSHVSCLLELVSCHH